MGAAIKWLSNLLEISQPKGGAGWMAVADRRPCLGSPSPMDGVPVVKGDSHHFGSYLQASSTPQRVTPCSFGPLHSRILLFLLLNSSLLFRGQSDD